MRKIATLLPALIPLFVLARGQTCLITGTVTDNYRVSRPIASVNIKNTSGVQISRTPWLILSIPRY
jgi:hypothetical protein